MQLINCKVKSKLKWTKYCILSAAGNDNNINENADVNDVFNIKDTKLYVLVVTLSERVKNDVNFLAKDLKYPFIGVNIK